MLRWLNALLDRPGRHSNSTLPLGVDGELPWHCTVPDARRILRTLGALSLDIDGYPTARLRWGDLTVRARLEFASGVQLDDGTWLPAHTDALLYTREGLQLRMEPRMRAASVLFPERDRRGNWRKALGILGKPSRRLKDGSWLWEGNEMSIRFVDADPEDEGSVEWLRFAASSKSRVLEILNQSSLELFDRLNVRVDFPAGRWEMGEAPGIRGVAVRLYWDVPAGQALLVTAVANEREISVEVPPNKLQVVITNDGKGGLRIVV